MQSKTEVSAEGPEKLLLRVDEVAQRLSVGRATVYQMISSGALRTVRIGRGGRAVRVPVKSLQEWLESQQRGTAA